VKLRNEPTTNLVCLTSENLRECFAADTSFVYGRGKVITADANKLTYSKAEHINKKSNYVYRIRTQSGRFLDVTKEHYLLTDSGYQKVKDLTKNDSLVGAINWPDLKGEILPAKFIGYWLGNGSAIKYQVPSWTSGNITIAQEFIKTFENLFGSTPNYNYKKSSATYRTYEIPNYVYPLRDWLKVNDLWGYYSWEKFIPNWFMEMAGKQSWAELLEGLWETDGCVVKRKTDEWCLKYHTTSYKLAQQILYGLAFLGIYATIREIPIMGKMKRPAWEIKVTDGWRQIFKEKIKLHGNRNCDNLTVKYGNFSNRFSVEFTQNYSLHHSYYRYQPPKRLGYWFAKQNGNSHWNFCNFVPDQIISIRYLGKKKVFDKYVEKTHNLVVNGLIAHNSGGVEQTADCVVLIHRPVYYEMREIDIETEDDGEAWLFVAWRILMFKCEQCGRQSKSGEKQYTKIIQKRKRHYDNGSEGWEIVKEIKVCGECKNVLQEKTSSC